MTRRTDTLAVALVALAIVLSVVREAFAHDDAMWIMRDPTYVDARGVHCCGPSDCSRVPLAQVIERDGGVEIAGYGFLPLATRGHYRSIDPDWWACVDPAGRVKCVFHGRLDG